MQVDIIGRVNNVRLPKTKGLLPLYEAVVNSIQATEGLEGEIRVQIFRDQSQETIYGDDGSAPISGFSILDHGVGFDESNFKSFQTSDSTLKAQLGGKGIGRFMWLKAFDAVNVDSVYRRGRGHARRKFDFLLTADSIENIAEEQSVPGPRRTRILLQGLKPYYQQYMPKTAKIVAQRLLQHCLGFFIYGDVPRITVTDGSEEISLNDYFDQFIKGNIDLRQIQIRKALVELSIIKYQTTSESAHEVFYCANRRDVRSERIGDTIPLLGQRLTHDGQEFVFLVYVSGSTLDELVNQERTGFDFPVSDPDGQEALNFSESFTFEELRAAVMKDVQQAAEPFLATIRAAHRQRLTDIINEKAPEYRHVLKYKPTDLDSIPPNSSTSKIELDLHRISQKLDREVKLESLELAKSEPNKTTNLEEYKTKYHEIIEKLTDIGMSNLAKYVTHRKMILRLLENRLEIQDDGKYALEEAVHEIIFPMRTTSEDVGNMEQNLWIIDEKLSYHFLLASDLPFRDVPATASTSGKRPDLLVFNSPLAFAGDAFPYSSIVVIEFKRPARNDYGDDENPIVQIQRYVTEIRENKVKDRKGKFIEVTESTPCYAYIVCALTPKMKEFAKVFSFYPTPDGQGYYWFNQNLRTYIEIISFEKLLSDAKKRNRVLFERLGLHLEM